MNNEQKQGKYNVNGNAEAYLKDEFFKAVDRYNDACKKNGGYEGSVEAFKARAEMELLQRLLFDLCGLSYEVKYHFRGATKNG